MAGAHITAAPLDETDLDISGSDMSATVTYIIRHLLGQNRKHDTFRTIRCGRESCWGYAECLSCRRLWGRPPFWNSSFLETICFFTTHSYSGEPLWPRHSVIGLRPPQLKFRILCLEDSVVWFVSPSSWGSPGSVWPVCVQCWPIYVQVAWGH